MARPKSITDSEIREAARTVFLEEGPSAPVSHVAERLGVSHAAVFSRAGSKRELMLDALGPKRPPTLDILTQPPPTEGVLSSLTEVLIDLMAFFERVVPNLIVLKAAGIEVEAPAEALPPPVMLRDALADWLDAANATTRDPRAVAEGLLGAMEARCFNAYLGGRQFAPGDDAEFVTWLVHELVMERT